MPQVESSNISSVSYEERGRVMTVSFHAGTTHAYTGVPKAVYLRVLNAESVGREFYDLIRMGGYSFRKV